MEELKTKYITEDDFKNYFGEDLSALIHEDDNPSNTANSFLFRLEVRMATFIDANFYRNVDVEYKNFSDYQKQHYKFALLEQAMYIIRNSEISVDSGYDPETGIIASRDELKNITIGENAKQHLLLCGLWCRKIKNVRGGSYGSWLY